MLVTRKRLLATAALPLLAASLATGGALAKNSQTNPPIAERGSELLLAQAPAECPPGTVPADGGCVAQEPEQQQPAEEPAPPAEEAPAEPPAPEPPAEAPPEPAPAPEPAPEPEPAPASEPAPDEAAPQAEEQAPPPTDEAPAAEEAPAEPSPLPEAPAEEPAPEDAAPAEEQAPAAEEAPAEPPVPEEAPAEEQMEGGAPDAPAAQDAPVDEPPVPEEAPADAAPDASEPESAPVPQAAPEEAPADDQLEGAPAEDQPAAEEPAPDAGEPAPQPEEPAAEPDQPASEDGQPAQPPAAEGEPDAGPEVEGAPDAPAAEEGQQPDAAPTDEEPLPPGEAPVEGAPDASGGQPAAAPEQQPAPELEMLPVENGAPVLDSAKEQLAPLPLEAPAAEGQQQPDAPETEAPAQAQPDPEEMERLRQRIERLEAERGQRPTSDAEAQAIIREFAAPAEFQSVTAIEGQRLQTAPDFEPRNDITIINQTENRYVYEVNNQIIVENNDRDRLARFAEDIYYEELPEGRLREVVIRDNGVQVITIRNRYGDIIQRSRIRPSGEEVILFYTPDYGTDDYYVYSDPGRYLPPLELTIPVEQYIYESSRADDYTDYVTFFEQPPVEPVTQIYTVEEVKNSARVRDIMPRVDLDKITFEFGSAEIGDDQIRALEAIANGILAVLEEDDSEIFLIEGHTDAVGTDEANLILSDRRAEAVAIALTNAFGIPPENLQVQGYGERYLKVNTQEPERLNRRVTIRRITPLVQSAEVQQ